MREEETGDRAKWKRIICCGDPGKEKAKKKKRIYYTTVVPGKVCHLRPPW